MGFDLERRARELGLGWDIKVDPGTAGTIRAPMERACQLAREACAAQAEDMAQRLDAQPAQQFALSMWLSKDWVVRFVRSFAAPTPPRSREEVYREALEMMPCCCASDRVPSVEHEPRCPRLIAMRALSYTPQGGGGAGG